jgi:hypothetical protein
MLPVCPPRGHESVEQVKGWLIWLLPCVCGKNIGSVKGGSAGAEYLSASTLR